MKDFIDEIELLVIQPTQEPLEDGVKVNGKCVGVSDIAGISKKRITVESDLFVFDEDAVLRGTTIEINSNNGMVIGKKVLSVKGLPGAPFDVRAEDGKKEDDESYRKNSYGPEQALSGSDGKQGNAGGDGGTVTLKFSKESSNLKNLTINASGSDGGSGQNGGNGARGCNSDDTGGRMWVESRREAALYSRKKLVAEGLKGKTLSFLKGMVTFNSRFRETFRSGGGQIGGNPGRGGAGGSPGKIGAVEVDVCGNERPVTVIEEGYQGMEGKAGIQGFNGDDGLIYEGVYMNEVVAAGVRGYKDDYDANTSSKGLNAACLAATAGAAATQNTTRTVFFETAGYALSNSGKTLFQNAVGETGRTALGVVG